MSEIRVRREPPPGLGEMLSRARMRAGYRLREAARLAKVHPGYLCNLELNRRSPSRAVAEVLAELYGLEHDEREQLLAAAVVDAGRSIKRTA